MSEINKQEPLQSSAKRAGMILGFYLAFALAYQAALTVTSEGHFKFGLQIVLDYSLKGLLTIPLWFLMRRVIPHWTLGKKVLIHLLILPVWVLVWQQIYYFICDKVGYDHLSWPFSGWDIYIPTLFYVLQFGIFHAWESYHSLLKQQKREAELRRLSLQSELKALKAQINPHFLYNTFNTISASVPPGQEHTRELIATLSDLFRYQLKASREELVDLDDELEFVKKYLELEKERFGDRLNIIFNVQEGLSGQKIPPMLIQPLVENAIKHGISPKIEGGEVAIIISRLEKDLKVLVSDSGVGMKEKAGQDNGVGLANTQKRLKMRYGSMLDIEKNEPSGVKISFTIPAS